VTDKILNIKFQGNSITRYIVLTGILLAIVIVLLLMKKKLISRLKTKYAETANAVLVISLIEKTLTAIISFSAVYAASYMLELTDTLRKIVNAAYIFIVIFFVINVISCFIDLFVKNTVLNKESDARNYRTIKIIATMLKIIIWGIAAFVFLDNIGVNITSLVAGLGIGGVAVALAAQTILGDLFSCFIIYLDKPFEIGDYITIDTFSGTIEHIGVKTTRIRSLSGEQLVFSNSDLTTSRVRNYKRMEKRRINFTISVAYETEYDVLVSIPDIIAGIIKNIDNTEFERCHFSSYGDYGLLFETVYYVLTSDYIQYMNIQQEINLKINSAFRHQKIEFAYPTQIVILRKYPQ